MDTSRDDVGIAIRSAFLRKGTQQRYSLFVLTVLCLILIFFENFQTKPLNLFRSVVKDIVYRSAVVANFPSRTFSKSYNFFKNHFTLYSEYNELVREHDELKGSITKSDFLKLENNQLRKLIDEQVESPSNLLSARVMLDKQSPYLNSLVINIGSNKSIMNGMAVLDGKNFIGRIVDVNFFSSRVLLITDLNSKIPVISEPSGSHAILSGRGTNKPSLQYLSDNHKIKEGDKIYTSGKEGIFSPGLMIGKSKINKDNIEVLLFSDLKQITFVNINIGDKKKK